MSDGADFVISIHTVHARRILSGEKTVELRRRVARLRPGTRLWIYETLPVAAVTGYATVVRCDRDAPEELWRRYSDAIGVGRDAFFSYLDGCVEAVAIILTAATSFSPAATAADLRRGRDGFRAPRVTAELSTGQVDMLLALAERAERPEQKEGPRRRECKILRGVI
ncbi:ASCH domain-containing protein [Acidisphaera rubrifaciens]|uniref:ASCH domain-containing protein n=1 Tax=Acidisphaera rubrifaciens HS-AP3 TaxID=1231350 RepID=A0A0D6P782_9PROT|nr:hypothetical protein Asru_0151_03 [Acidisphaera rubrifaciens HS-AP3]